MIQTKTFALGFLMLFLISFSVSAGQKSPIRLGSTFIHESATCKIQGKKVELLLSSDNMEVDPEEQEFGYPFFSIRQGTQVERISLQNPELHLAKDSGGVCGKYAVYPAGADQILVVVRANGRPFSDQIAAVLYDTKVSKVLASRSELGSIYDLHDMDHREPTALKKTKNGFAFRTWNARTDGTSYPITLRGQKTQADEKDLDYWVEVTPQGKKIHTEVERKLTWQDSQYRPYFKDQSEFEKAFGLKQDLSGFSNDSTVMFVTLHGETHHIHCIQPTADRKPQEGDEKWFCDDHK